MILALRQRQGDAKSWKPDWASHREKVFLLLSCSPSADSCLNWESTWFGSHCTKVGLECGGNCHILVLVNEQAQCHSPETAGDCLDPTLHQHLRVQWPLPEGLYSPALVTGVHWQVHGRLVWSISFPDYSLQSVSPCLSQLVSHIEEMLQTAYNKLHSWQSRRLMKKTWSVCGAYRFCGLKKTDLQWLWKPGWGQADARSHQGNICSSPTPGADAVVLAHDNWEEEGTGFT